MRIEPNIVPIVFFPKIVDRMGPELVSGSNHPHGLRPCSWPFGRRITRGPGDLLTISPNYVLPNWNDPPSMSHQYKLDHISAFSTREQDAPQSPKKEVTRAKVHLSWKRVGEVLGCPVGSDKKVRITGLYPQYIPFILRL